MLRLKANGLLNYMGFILVLYTPDVAMMQMHFIYNMFILSFVLVPFLFIENSVRHGLTLETLIWIK
jgi:hypothetical protein